MCLLLSSLTKFVFVRNFLSLCENHNTTETTTVQNNTVIIILYLITQLQFSFNVYSKLLLAKNWTAEFDCSNTPSNSSAQAPKFRDLLWGASNPCLINAACSEGPNSQTQAKLPNDHALPKLFGFLFGQRNYGTDWRQWWGCIFLANS